MQELDSPPNILNMSIINNVSSIILLPTESLLREMPKVPICEIKTNEKKLIVEIIFALLMNKFCQKTGDRPLRV